MGTKSSKAKPPPPPPPPPPSNDTIITEAAECFESAYYLEQRAIAVRLTEDHEAQRKPHPSTRNNRSCARPHVDTRLMMMMCGYSRGIHNQVSAVGTIGYFAEKCENLLKTIDEGSLTAAQRDEVSRLRAKICDDLKFVVEYTKRSLSLLEGRSSEFGQHPDAMMKQKGRFGSNLGCVQIPAPLPQLVAELSFDSVVRPISKRQAAFIAKEIADPRKPKEDRYERSRCLTPPYMELEYAMRRLQKVKLHDNCAGCGTIGGIVAAPPVVLDEHDVLDIDSLLCEEAKRGEFSDGDA